MDKRKKFIRDITGEPADLNNLHEQFVNAITVAKEKGLKPQRTVETKISTYEVWVNRVHNEKGKKLSEILDALKSVIKPTYKNGGGYEYFTVAGFESDKNLEFPLQSDLIVYARPGRSEGSVIIIEALNNDGRKHLFTLKEFYPLEVTLKRANEITKWYYQGGKK